MMGHCFDCQIEIESVTASFYEWKLTLHPLLDPADKPSWLWRIFNLQDVYHPNDIQGLWRHNPGEMNIQVSIRCHHALYLPARLGDDQAAPLTRLSPGAPRVLLAARPPGEPPPFGGLFWFGFPPDPPKLPPGPIGFPPDPPGFPPGPSGFPPGPIGIGNLFIGRVSPHFCSLSYWLILKFLILKKIHWEFLKN